MQAKVLLQRAARYNGQILAKIEVHGNILLTNEFTPKVPKNYYLTWKQRDQEYYKFSAREGKDLYKIFD